MSDDLPSGTRVRVDPNSCYGDAGMMGTVRHVFREMPGRYSVDIDGAVTARVFSRAALLRAHVLEGVVTSTLSGGELVVDVVGPDGGLIDKLEAVEGARVRVTIEELGPACAT